MPMHTLPDLVTHSYSPSHAPFGNLCALPDVEAEAILAHIRSAGGGRLRTDYLRRRHQTEAWLIGESKGKIAGIKRPRPIYFFLGDYADGQDPFRTASIVLPLSSFPAEAITFTYPDSMASLSLARHGDPAHRRPYHGQVFTLEEIVAVVAEYGRPGHQWRTDPSKRYDRFIEMQLWDDRCLARLRDV